MGVLLCFAVERVGWFWFLNLVVVAGWVFVCEFGELLLVACWCVVGCFTGWVWFWLLFGSLICMGTLTFGCWLRVVWFMI